MQTRVNRSSAGGEETKMRKLAAYVLVAALVISGPMGLGASPAAAHSGNQTYVYMDVTDTSLSGRIEAPIPDMAVALGLDEVGGNQAFVDANQEAIVDYLTEHIVVRIDGQEWPIDIGEVSVFFSDAPELDDNYLVAPFTVTVASDEGTVPRAFEMEFDPFVEEIPGRDALLLIANDWRAGVIDNGFDTLTTFGADNRTQTVDLGESSWWKNFVASIELGVNHIRTGPDHVLFVLVLLLPAVLVFNRKWWPTDGFVASLWRILKIVTMFTIAHSITFTLAGLGLLPLPPSKLVEFIIALSIAAAALHNIRPLFPNKEWLLSFVFGLFHGMGFASLVEGLDVPRSVQLVSLLGRNVGIEIGQAVVVVLLFPLLYLLRRTRIYQPIFVVLSVLMAVISLAWMWERLFETELGINNLIDPIFESFGVLVAVVAVLTVLAAVFQKREGDAGRLLPMMADATDGDVVLDLKAEADEVEKAGV